MSVRGPRDALEAYLDRACRGLWGARRDLVREELRANLLHGALDFEAAGAPPDEAVTRALRAFGSPARLAFALWRVHTWPRVAQTLLLLASLGSAGLGVFSWARAQAQHHVPPTAAPPR